MKKRIGFCGRGEEIVFMPALTPLEAAMLPAREPPRSGALSHVMRETERRFSLDTECGRRGQRAKIWVR